MDENSFLNLTTNKTMETTIYNIEKGHEFYTVFGDKITKYIYLCVYPSYNAIYETPENYHILINKTAKTPMRVYHKNLTQMLEENLKTYDEAKLKVKKHLEDKIEKFDKYF